MRLEFNRKMSSGNAENAIAGGTSATDIGSDSATEQGPVEEVRALLNFLKIEVEIREKTSKEQHEDAGGKPAHCFPMHEHPKRRLNNVKTRNATATALHGRTDSMECFLCKSKAHSTPDCNAKIELNEKKRRLQANRRCFRCTKPNHTARMCRGTLRCDRCGGRYVSTMCDPDYLPGRAASGLDETRKKDRTPLNLHVSEKGNKPAVLLQTVTAWVESKNRRKLARILFDSGSQRSFITEELSRGLGCKLLGTEVLTVGVFGGKTSEQTYRRVQVVLSNRLTGQTYEIDALETRSICEQELPGSDEDIMVNMEELGLTVGDDLNGLECNGVGILLGSEHYWGCVTGRVRRLSENLTAVETAFGWAVHGRSQATAAVVNCSQVIVLRAAVSDQENTAVLRGFWELESMGVVDAEVQDHSDSDIMQRFEKSITKSDRRYEVSLPWKPDVKLDCNREMAWKRLESQRKRLSKNPELMQRYNQAVRLYVENGMAERVERDDNSGEHKGPDERPLGQQTGVLKVLGLTRKPNEDSVSFSAEHVIEFARQRRNTKRFVLQTTARLYDPLGFLSPFVVRAKILFPEICKLNLRWDDILPEELMSDWNNWCDELTTLQQINVPRFYDSELKGNVVHRTLHVFSDASTSAYGSMIFICSTDDTGETTATLLLAKCRVSPLKEICLARLELMACLIGSKLFKYVRTHLEIKVDEVHFWTDSMIALH
ncbi:uncharacterized protein LOC120849166 [Ixodes scapularis]|uniref:uncharacterized protein LOC120849166 n=1 Tax=Ixodes scapularis TaxID=6945 RepID=UPI001A9FA8E9|nr:uncharacterized protein LOC120849166 [Ixodes scapularis]